MANEDLQKYIDILAEKDCEAKVIDPATVETAAWVAYKCRYGCGSYNKTCYCPPNSPTWKETRELLDCFHRGILFRTEARHTPTINAVALSREAFLDGYYKTIAFGEGPCKRCEICTPNDCKMKGKIVPAMEAAGIDVFATARNNGFDIKTLRSMDETPHFYGLVLID